MSLALPIIIQAEAPQKPEDINSFIKAFVELLTQHIQPNAKLLSNIKLILIEYCTNAIKHVTDEVNIIQAELDKPILRLKKIDKAPKFKIGDLILSHDILLNYAFIELHRDSFQFILRDDKQQENINLIPEHFGFEIVIRASEEFIYQYNKEDKTNVFCASLTLN
ncbi:hypothetical protein FYC62_05740 [Pedobacter aquae]|uniref:Uncharacterized protein n=1 Tax=Pedobacter aquae TaxID=2605747 RepID=A0A5C0VGN7_9SPHI|nr:hypothetical protein [Pedobacter aquae]QEK51229.1 hypothetical protein FYC62_05740 [Pedobacter aquae]